MTSRHFIAGLNTTLNGEVDLDNLQHSRRQIVTALQLAFALFESLIQLLTPCLESRFGRLELFIEVIFFHSEFEPILGRKLPQVRRCDLVPFLQLRSSDRHFSTQRTGQPLVSRVFNDRILGFDIFSDTRKFLLLNVFRPLILLQTVSGKDAHINHGAICRARNPEAGVFYIRRLLSKNSPQEFLFWR